MSENSRQATEQRKTRETSIELTVNLDGTGRCSTQTGIGFLDHMLELLARHGGFDLSVEASGDLDVDQHHTTEDVGIVLGRAFARALGPKRGIVRYADVRLPMEESLAAVALDISGRAMLVFNVQFPAQKIGVFDVELVREFWQAFCLNAGVNMHVDLVRGDNAHHVAEAVFKGCARALRAAVAIDPRFADSVPSTKGTL